MFIRKEKGYSCRGFRLIEIYNEKGASKPP